MTRIFHHPLTAAVLLFLVCFLLGGDFHSHALVYYDSDYGAYQLLTEEIARGRYRIFLYDQPYGGLPFTYLRALFASLSAPLFGQGGVSTPAFEAASEFFSYVIMPFLLSFWAFICLRYADGIRCAWIGALICAVGVDWWVGHFYNDIYPPIAFYAFGALAFRKRYPNGVFSLRSVTERTVTGALCGFALYCHRLTVIPLVVALSPNWDQLKLGAQVQLDALRAHRWLRITVLSLVILSAYLWFFGREVGYLPGQSKLVKIDVLPNLKIAALILVVFHFSRNLQSLKNLTLHFLPFVGGMVIGLFPELLFKFSDLDPDSRIKQPLPDEVGLRYLPDFVAEFLKLPAWFSGLFTWNRSIFAFPMVMIATIPFFISIRKEHPSRHTLIALRIGLCLTLFLVFFVSTMNAGKSAQRYLYPCVPLVFGFFALWLSGLKEKKHVVFALLALGSFELYHLQGRLSFRSNHQLEKKTGGLYEVRDRFKNEGLHYVLVDTYWRTYDHTHLVNHEVTFLQMQSVNSRGRKPDEEFLKLRRSPSIGLWTEKPLTTHPIYLEDGKYCWKQLGELKINTGYVYRADRC